MSSSNSPRAICLPAHILDAHISPRAREVLMLLASQTTIEHPAVWVCQAAIAERLRCSPVTVKRAIQKLVEAKLIVETGDLHERRYKFYRVHWSLSDKPSAKAGGVKKAKRKDWMPAFAGMTKNKEMPAPVEKFAAVEEAEPIEQVPPAPAPPPPPQPKWNPLPTSEQLSMLKDPTLAHYAELARQKHLEYLRRYNIDPNSFR